MKELYCWMCVGRPNDEFYLSSSWDGKKKDPENGTTYQLVKLHKLQIRSPIVCRSQFYSLDYSPFLYLTRFVVCKFRDLYFTFVVASVT